MIRTTLLLLCFFACGFVHSQTITPAGPTGFCPGGSITLTINNSPGGSNYQWVRNGTNIAGATGVSYTTNIAATYTAIVTTPPDPPVTLNDVVVAVYAPPVADFTFNNNNTCSGTSVQFTSLVTTGTAPFTYAWDFNDGSPVDVTQNPAHAFTSLGCGTGNFNVKLTVTDANGCKSTIVTKPVSVKQAPDMKLLDADPFTPFSNCDKNPTPLNPTFNLIVSNNTPSGCVAATTLDWGDGSPIITNPVFPLTHTYTQLGAYNLVFTGTGINGCTYAKTYIVANQTNPAGGLGTLGSTTGLCAPSAIPFIISNWQNNSPGTKYILNFGDGTSITLNHPLTTDTVYHNYVSTSCPNATTFTATLRVVNACDSTPYSAGNIQIRIAPRASFSSPVSACINTSVCPINTTAPGYTGSSCITTSVWAWDFGDGSPIITTQNACHAYTTPGTYTITLTANNPCGTNTFSKQICITGPPTSVFTVDKTEGCAPLVVATTNTSSAGETCATATYLWTVTYSPTNCGTTVALPYFTSGTTSTSVSPVFNFTNPGTYTIRLAVTNTCGTVSSTKTVVIKNPPKVTLPVIPTACASVTFNPGTGVTITNCGNGPLTYLWTFTNGTPATSTNADPGPVSFNTPGSNTVTLAVTNECGTTTATQNFTIAPAPDLTVPSNTTICGGQTAGPFTFTSTTTGTTFSWTNNNTTIGLGASGNGNTIPSFTAINNTANPITVTIAVSGTKGGCPSTQSFTITVNPRPAKPVVVRPVTYCLNEAATPLSATATAGNTINWYTSYPLSGGSNAAPTPNTTVAGSTTYYAVQNNGTCESDTSKIIVTVNPKIAANTIGIDQTICNGSNAQPFTSQATITGGSGTYLYQWQQSTDGGTTWTNITGATSAPYNPGALSAEVKYRRVVNSSTCSDTSNVVTVTVQGSLTNTGIGIVQTICINTRPDTLRGQTPVGGNGVFTYQWESSPNNTTWTPITGATGIDFLPPALSSTTYYRRIVSSGQCSITSLSVQITVNPKPVMASIADRYFCNNSASGVINFTSVPAATSFVWINDNTSIGLAATGTGSIGSFNTINNSNPKIPVTATIKVVPVFTANGISCLGDTVAFKIVVLPAISISIIPDLIKCTGATIAPYTPVADTVALPGSTLQYSWTVSGSSISLTNGNGTQLPAYNTFNSGLTDLVTTVTVTPKYTYAGKTCDGTPTSYTVTVKPATANANAGTDQTICAQTTVNLSATVVSGTTGVWSQVGTGAGISSPTSNITTVTGLTPGTVYKFVWTQSGFASCPATTDTVVIDNKPALVNKIDVTTETICAGSIVNIAGFVATGGGATYSYQWEQSTDGINYTAIATAISQNITITPTTTVWLRRFVAAPPCSGYSDTVKVTVQPALANNNISADATICIGIVASQINGALPTGGNNQFTYVWQQSINGGVTWTAITGATTTSYPPGVLMQTTKFRRIVATDLCSGPFVSTSNVVTITVNPDARAFFLPTDTVKCPPFIITPAIINLQTSAANNQYLWYANGTLFGSGATFPGYTITNENDSVIIKLKVVSTFGCKDDSLSKKFKTIRKPTPFFTLTDTVGCGSITVNFTNTSTYVNEYTYFWDFDNGQTSTAIQPAAITFAPNPAYGDTTYWVKLKVFSPCDTLTFTKSIRVKSKPKALFTPTKTVGCSPMVVTFRNTSKGFNNTYLWNFGDGTTLSTTSPDPLQHTFITGVVDTFYVKLKAVNECGSDSITYSIIVAPNTIRLNLAVNGTDRFGCAPHAVALVNNSQGASVFRWNFGDGAITTTTKNVDTVYHTYLTPGTYTATLQAINNCSDTTTTETITVYPKPRAAFTADKFTVCKGDTVRFTNLSDSATAFLWKFGDGLTSTLTSPLHSYTTPGTYVVKLITYRNNPSGNVCTDSTTQPVTVTATQTGFFTVSDSVSQCAPLMVTFVNKNKPSVTAVWNFGDGSSATGDSVVHTYQTFGTYNVKLTVAVPGGCTYITNKTVTVNGPGGTLRYSGGYACYPAAVQLQAVATGVSTYVWDFGDGATQTTTQQVVFHTYNNPGFYLPKVTLQNAAGCNVQLKGVDTIKVDKVDGGFTIAKNETCGLTTLTFTDTSRAFFGKQMVKWNFGDGTFGTGTSSSHIYTAGGAYSIEMIVAGNSGCTDTVTQQINVLVKTKPTVAIAAITTACTRRSVQFTGVIQSADAINLTQWNVSNGASGAGPVFNQIFTLPGTYTLRLVVGTVNGCFDTAYHTITINPSPVVVATPSLDLCRGSLTQLTVTGAAAYQWLPLSGLTCYTCTNPIASPTITTPYVVEGKNSFGCADYDTVVITVIQPLKMNVSTADSICIGESTNLLASGGISYNWSPAIGLNNTTISNPTASPTVTTTYRVVGYDGFNCFTDTAFLTIGVGQYPTITLGPDLILPAGTLQQLQSSVTNGPITKWLWKPPANLSCSNCAVPVAEVKKNISYTVIATTAYGCSASDTINIKVTCSKDQVFVPNAFSPDGDGINDILMVRASGIVSVKYFRVFNRWGEVVFEQSNFVPNNPLYGWNGKVKGVAGGPDVFVYTWEAICENGSVLSDKGNVTIIK